jgi:8-oxo-dGTP pyrophosphatase MutT (NUDIX family)
MENSSDILTLVEDYRKTFTDEVERTSSIVNFVDSFDGFDLFDRNNFTGHVTASAYIINTEKDALLLLKHKALNRWLQPGGHVDATDASLVDAALREAEEETGIAKDKLSLVSKEVFYLDSHIIPANEKKQEAQHYHHDVGFLFTCSVTSININEAESTASKWVPFSQLLNEETFQRLIKKIRNLQ